MDTITEAATSEAEETSQAGDSRSPGETQAAPAAQDASTTPQSETTEDPEAREKSEEPVPAETKAHEENREDGRAATPPGSEGTVQDATQTPDQIDTESCTVHGDVESVTPQEHYNRAFITDDLEEQPIQV